MITGLDLRMTFPMYPGPSTVLRVSLPLLLLAGGCAPDTDDAAPDPIELPPPHLFQANERLHNVRDIALGQGGDVWVVSGFAPFVHQYRLDGSLLQSFGRNGPGPGEMTYPQGIFRTAEGNLRVWDPGKRALIDFLPDGTFAQRQLTLELGSAPVMASLEDLSYARGRVLRPWGRGYLLQEPTRQLSSARAMAETLLLVLDSAGAIADTLVDFRQMAAGAGDLLGDARELVPIPLWTTCASGRAAVLNPYGGTIRWFSPGSAEPELDSLTLPERPVTDQDVRRSVQNSLAVEEREQGFRLEPAERERLIARVVSEGRDGFGRIAPPAVSMICAEDETLWLQRFDTETDPRGYGREWAIVRDGQVRGYYRFPTGFQPLIVADDRVLGISRNEMDVQRPASVERREQAR